jgi:hypothetical protein
MLPLPELHEATASTTSGLSGGKRKLGRRRGCSAVVGALALVIRATRSLGLKAINGDAKALLHGFWKDETFSRKQDYRPLALAA